MAVRMPFLVIRPEREGLVCIGNVPAGEAGPQRPLSVPVAPEGVHWLTFFPKGSGCVSLRLPMRGGRPVEGELDERPGADFAYHITGRAGGAWEIELYTPKPAPRGGTLPRTLESLAAGAARVSLVEHDGLSLAVEQTEEDRVVAWHDLPEWVSGTLSERDLPPGSVLLLGHGEEEQRVAVLDCATGTLLLEAAGREIEAGDTITVSRALGDVAGHVVTARHRWDGEKKAFAEERRVTLPERKSPASAEDVALALCQALALGLEDEALEYVTPGMRAKLQPGRLALALGPFDRCISAGVAGGEVWIEAIQPVSETLSTARMVAFRVLREGARGAFLVDDLRSPADPM